MRFLSLLALLAAAWPPAQAQQVGRVEGRQVTPGGYYVNAQPGEPTTRVYVWGSVLRPGVYEVGPGFDVASLVALAGGPARLNADERDLAVEVQVQRDDAVLLQTDFEALAERAASVGALRDGDVIVLSLDRETRVAVWGDVAQPGLYAVPAGASVQTVLALAGGPRGTPLRNTDRRENALRYVRASGETLYDGPLAELPPDLAAAPVQSGDLLEVESRARQRWSTRDTLTLVGVGISAVVAVTQVVRVLE